MFKSARKFYFTVASLGGLLLVVIGLITLLHLGISELLQIKTMNYETQPPDLKGYVGDISGQEGVTKEQKEAIVNWSKDYNDWKERQKGTDWESNTKKEQIAMSASFFLVGLPIFLYHIRFVRKEEE